MNSSEKVFGAILRKLRKEKGFTQTRLAFDSALDRSYISLLESGLRQPSLPSLLQISNALGVKASEVIAMVEWLIDDKEELRSDSLSNVAAQ